MLGFAALAMDVGYWYSQKREVQKAVDAAALAGAQELPDDYVMAESKAREYLTKNGVSTTQGRHHLDNLPLHQHLPDRLQSRHQPLGHHRRQGGAAGAGVVRQGLRHPAGADEGRARRGLQRVVRRLAFQPVDVVQILDRTGSMSGADMTNAKDGAKALLEYFHAQPATRWAGGAGPQHLPGATPVASSPPGSVWLPVNLSDDYQNSPRSPERRAVAW